MAQFQFLAGKLYGSVSISCWKTLWLSFNFLLGNFMAQFQFLAGKLYGSVSTTQLMQINPYALPWS